MSCKVNEQLDELRLVADILDTLAKTEQRLRPDQVTPITERIRRAVENIEKSSTEKRLQVYKDFSERDRSRRADGLPDIPQQGRQPSAQCRASSTKKFVVTKPSSISAFPVPRAKCPQGQLAVSKEVSRYLACTLYNILEGATRLLKASTAHIFVRKGDEMVSIANCSAKLSFPPQLVRHRCLGSADAEVLASGIAFNQHITDGSKTTSSLLIFPALARDPPFAGALAVVHVENKLQGSVTFDGADEGILLTAAQLVGELMSRFPQMDWIVNFYDPATQHILAPFEPRKRVPMSRGMTSRDQQAFITETPNDAELNSDAIYWRKVEEYESPLLIRREVLPRLASQKPLAQGLSSVPTLREVDAYVENIHSCWKRSVSSNVALSEEERSNQIELKVARRELTRMKALYEDAAEQLRLYRLEGRDYEEEFRSIKGELDAYVRKRDKMDVL
ncbi:hypothetical protein DQ04_00571030 [Trypanosoma grayi]|uniref:hypothetical protein n=1 Tax=Trypanosoma grayi TaxID=71804 RepID=UPI0004F44ADA|nr:hypothetical protein DQ04_00571030 [Trypanosoma grayi]KEG14208.1 hypothetical protein DQ04_00571030 [Trypanosoma grayi]